MEAWLDAGQTLRLGDVELSVESTEANMAIPEFKRPAPATAAAGGFARRRACVFAPSTIVCDLPMHELQRSDVQRLRPCHAAQRRRAAFSLRVVQPQVRADLDGTVEKEKRFSQSAGHGQVEVQPRFGP